MICIWCRKDFSKLSLEHAIPDALACPKELELDDITCEACNNNLGYVDQGLVKQFETISVVYGVKRKGGRAPTIDSWRAITSKRGKNGPEIYLNAGPGVIDAGHKKLHPAAKSNGITDVWAKPDEGQMGFAQEFGNDSRFLPALFKIGLSLVAKHFGTEEAACDKYDHIRSFVWGEEKPPTLTAAWIVDSPFVPRSKASGPIIKENRPYPCFNVEILGVNFFLDLDPEQLCMRDVRGAATLTGQPLNVFPRSNGMPRGWAKNRKS
jgi:hypothetical protein